MDDTQTLCSSCAPAEALARALWEALGEVVDVPPDAQPTVEYVMSCRRMLDDLADRMYQDLHESAAGALEELQRLAIFLHQRFPAVLAEHGDRESPAGIAIRILSDRPERRIIVP